MWKIICVMAGILTLGSVARGDESQLVWTSFKLIDQGQMELSYNVPSGQTYVIETSEDLTHWRLATDPMVTSQKATDWVAPGTEATQRFYRLVLVDRDWERLEFDRNRRRWAEQSLGSYQYVFNWNCFCLPEHTAPVNIKVERGEWSDISLVGDGTPVKKDDWKRYKTIDELFDIIDEAFLLDAKEISVEYDSDFGYPTSVFIDYDEMIADEERGFNVKLEVHPLIQWMSRIPDAADSDAFRLLGANVSGDLLEIEVQYGGGCRDHSFEIVADPDAFMESWPVQANIYMTHESYDDFCKAIVRKKLVFSLLPLIETFKDLYPQNENLILNVHGYRLDGKGTILVVPLDVDPR